MMEDQEFQDHLVPADPKNGRNVMKHESGLTFTLADGLLWETLLLNWLHIFQIQNKIFFHKLNKKIEKKVRIWEIQTKWSSQRPPASVSNI